MWLKYCGKCLAKFVELFFTVSYYLDQYTFNDTGFRDLQPYINDAMEGSKWKYQKVSFSWA